MSSYTIDSIKNNIEQISKEISISHKPAIIQSEKGNMVLLSEDDYNAIVETLYLASIPNMTCSILEADREPLEDCQNSLDW